MKGFIRYERDGGQPQRGQRVEFQARDGWMKVGEYLGRGVFVTDLDDVCIGAMWWRPIGELVAETKEALNEFWSKPNSLTLTSGEYIAPPRLPGGPLHIYDDWHDAD